jgi:hypothetical protein
MKVYLIDKYDRWCPENNDGDYFIAAFSTKELAQKYVDKHDKVNKKTGKRESYMGLSIREFELDVEK